MTTLILLGVIGGVVLLGRYAIAEGHRVEKHKKFMKDLNEWDEKNKNGKK